ncbi:D-alanyl-D-alanine carboxypeptidase family protein [Corynebacterium lowii]|uniref:D-alanyl-D-alanine carboxypeptidase DacB n=1 Tax=Corynebacterium lowii TaxID=1544413 RepID=A0A0Q0YKP4_9CORY|nr:serine hydrolase [Corynebacterium lowii]KQB87504.1 D-alanyl-D-alanine carboxypeptidase DacB precursor [Corynebacterium lowii]MDP9851901.1 D-alanyl-D-alanine carboxypeptidase (penicillin-binding protein 5/6) [Corynebacterium lowii]
MLNSTARRILATTCVLMPLGLSTVLPAAAQQATPPNSAPSTGGAAALIQQAPGVDSSADHAEDSANQEEATDTPEREAAPDTNSCPHAQRPGDPTTTSEALAPGQQAPTPPPVTYRGSCGVTAAPGYRVPEEQTASAWLVFDIDSGEVIAQKDPHGRYRPASVIKVLLALVALRDLDYHAVIPVSERAANMEGSAVGIGTTGTYTTEDLLHGLLLASGNDAAQALAEALGGEQVALRKVNELAQQIGATDTHVGSVTGLDTAGQMTSVTDLARMYRYAWTNPTFAAIVNTEFWNFPGYEDHPGYEVWNDNGLFLNDPDGIGGKTGYTDDANHTFVGGMDRNGRRLAAVILDTTIDKGRPWEQAQRFLHAAYALPKGASIASLNDAPASSDQPSAAPTAPTESPDADASSEDKRSDALLGASIAGIVVLCALLGVMLSVTRGKKRR